MKIGNKVSAQVNEVALNAFQQQVREKVSCAETKYSTEQSPNDERSNVLPSSRISHGIYKVNLNGA